MSVWSTAPTLEATRRGRPRLAATAPAPVRSGLVAAKYFTVGSVATIVHHRGPTTLPGRPPAARDGATILCLHDVAGNGNVFAGVLDALADEHRPIAFDLPAHGRSGGLDSLGAIDAMAAHTKALADRLELDGPGPPRRRHGRRRRAGGGRDVARLAGRRRRVRRGVGDTGAGPGDDRAGPPRDGRSGAPPVRHDRLRARHRAGGLRAGVRGVDEDRPPRHRRRPRGPRRVGRPVAPRRRSAHRSSSWSASTSPPAARAAAEDLAAAVADGRVVELAGAGRRGVVEQPAALAAIVAGAAAGVPA